MDVDVRELIECTPGFYPVGLIYMKNGCCEDRPVVITVSGSGYYSCQCACGGWCTNGHRTATVAVLEYKHMSKGKGNWNMSNPNIEALEDAIVRFGKRLVPLSEVRRRPTQIEIDEVRARYGDD